MTPRSAPTTRRSRILLHHAPAVHLPNMESSSTVNHAQHAVVPGRVGCCGRETVTSRPRGIDSLLYDKLRRLAAFHLSREDREHPFEPADRAMARALLNFGDGRMISSRPSVAMQQRW